MRKLIMWNVITLDGYFEGKKNWDLSFHELVFGKELKEFSLTQLKSADILVFGLITYKGMADYWTKTKSEIEIAKFMNNIQKVVCSTTLKTADWNNTIIVKDAVAEISKLKQQGNGNMFVFGSSKLSESLMKAELFDEFRLCIAPVFLGNGRLLFKKGIPYKKLKLLEARSLTTGGIIIRYAPDEKVKLTMHFEIEIHEPVQKVRDTMLTQETYKEWTSVFEPTSYYEGSWNKGSKIKFLGSSGSGMISEIAENISYKFISIRHLGEIQSGVEDNSSEKILSWSPAYENYTFTDKGSKTHLAIDMEMPSTPETKAMKEMFEEMWPKALIKLKEVCEKEKKK